MKTPSDAGPIFGSALCVRSLAGAAATIEPVTEKVPPTPLARSRGERSCAKVARLGGAASGPLERA
jgi:hypothetical protein